jgi:hypothetical protein
MASIIQYFCQKLPAEVALRVIKNLIRRAGPDHPPSAMNSTRLAQQAVQVAPTTCDAFGKHNP